MINRPECDTSSLPQSKEVLPDCIRVFLQQHKPKFEEYVGSESTKGDALALQVPMMNRVCYTAVRSQRRVITESVIEYCRRRGNTQPVVARWRRHTIPAPEVFSRPFY